MATRRRTRLGRSRRVVARWHSRAAGRGQHGRSTDRPRGRKRCVVDACPVRSWLGHAAQPIDAIPKARPQSTSSVWPPRGRRRTRGGGSRRERLPALRARDVAERLLHEHALEQLRASQNWGVFGSVSKNEEGGARPKLKWASRAARYAEVTSFIAAALVLIATFRSSMLTSDGKW